MLCTYAFLVYCKDNENGKDRRFSARTADAESETESITEPDPRRTTTSQQPRFVHYYGKVSRSEPHEKEVARGVAGPVCSRAVTKIHFLLTAHRTLGCVK